MGSTVMDSKKKECTKKSSKKKRSLRLNMPVSYILCSIYFVTLLLPKVLTIPRECCVGGWNTFTVFKVHCVFSLFTF